MSRKQTTYLLELMDSGMISAEAVAEMALQYMSEDDVADMMRINDVLVEDDEDFGDWDDDWEAAAQDFEDSLEEIDPVSEAQEWADYDPDC